MRIRDGRRWKAEGGGGGCLGASFNHLFNPSQPTQESFTLYHKIQKTGLFFNWMIRRSIDHCPPEFGTVDVAYWEWWMLMTT